MSPLAPNRLLCKACKRPVPLHAISAARKGLTVRCQCGAVVDLAAAAAVRKENSTYAVAEDAAVAAAAKAPIQPVVVADLEEDAYRCPSCNAAMAPGTILCSACGFNLNTGEHLPVPGRKVAKAAASQTARRAASAFGVPKPTRPLNVREDRSGKLNQILITVVGMLFLIGLYWGGRVMWEHATRTPSYLGDDGRVAELTSDSGATEIHVWFAQDSSRIAGGYTTGQTLALADRLQGMGAKQVLAFGSRMTRTLAIELPEDPKQRAALFEWYNGANPPPPGGKPEVDQGQHYLLLGVGV